MLIVKCDKASSNRWIRVIFFQSLQFGHCVQCPPTLAAKFLPLKMLTVLSFLIFPYFYSLLSFLGSMGACECPIRFRDSGLGFI